MEWGKLGREPPYEAMVEEGFLFGLGLDGLFVHLVFGGLRVDVLEVVPAVLAATVSKGYISTTASTRRLSDFIAFFRLETISRSFEARVSAWKSSSGLSQWMRYSTSLDVSSCSEM